MTLSKPLAIIAMITIPSFSVGQDWAGPYAGIQVGNSDIDASGGLDGDGNSLGIFFGYNFNDNGIIYGGELDYDATEYEVDDGAAEVDSTTRLKGRIGAEVGGGLMYGTAGFVRATSSDLGDDTGYVYGAGYDYPVTDNITVGAELLQHEFEDYDDNDINVSVTTVKARIGFSF